jgi:AcrR family transcriptional regulator
MSRLAQWGPAGWTFLHSIGFSYPEATPTVEEKESMYKFLVHTGAVLPCRRCRRHYAAFVRARLSDPYCAVLADRESLSRFLVDLHNDVNRRLGRPEMSFERVRALYEGGDGGGGDSWTVIVAVVAVVAAVVIAAVMAAARKGSPSRTHSGRPP